MANQASARADVLRLVPRPLVALGAFLGIAACSSSGGETPLAVPTVEPDTTLSTVFLNRVHSDGFHSDVFGLRGSWIDEQNIVKSPVVVTIGTDSPMAYDRIRVQVIDTDDVLDIESVIASFGDQTHPVVPVDSPLNGDVWEGEASCPVMPRSARLPITIDVTMTNGTVVTTEKTLNTLACSPGQRSLAENVGVGL